MTTALPAVDGEPMSISTAGARALTGCVPGAAGLFCCACAAPASANTQAIAVSRLVENIVFALRDEMDTDLLIRRIGLVT